jgi:hypothetical protein
LGYASFQSKGLAANKYQVNFWFAGTPFRLSSPRLQLASNLRLSLLALHIKCE